VIEEAGLRIVAQRRIRMSDAQAKKSGFRMEKVRSVAMGRSVQKKSGGGGGGRPRGTGP
jgi:nucleoside diphosphate kinase